MKRVVGNMVEKSRYDVVVAEFALMGQHLYRNPYMSAVRRVISCHHSATIVKQTALDVLGPSAAALRERLCLYRLKHFEFNMYRSADQVLVLTPQERFALLEYAPNLRISVVPNGVDTDYFQPRDHEEAEPCILFTGHYEDEPNEDAVLWFINSVWPSLKKKHEKLKFYVVGPNPTEAMLDAAEKEPGVIITGFVEDVRTYLYRAQVFVCPIRMGAGMRGKILEAMASGLPVVSTTTGVEGIPAQIGDNCYLADRADIMAQMVDLLLSDLPLRQTLASQARAMVCERFDWEHGVSLLEKTLLDLVGRRI
jgi:glycosyltransferase involved in cell wall biosynthesis